MSESEIWEIIQNGNEISVLRIEVFITITVGVLVISSLRMIAVNLPLLILVLVAYAVFSQINFAMLIAEMEILGAGMEQIAQMQADGQDVSSMGRYLAGQLNTPLNLALIPILVAIHYAVLLSTVAYAIWRYRVDRAVANAASDD